MNKVDWQKSTAIATWITAILGLIGAVIIIFQLYQIDQYKKFENYNYFNKIYADWYHDMPQFLKECKTGINYSWDGLSADDRAWIRRYFDLYEEEYFFKNNNMIPEDMWKKLIHVCKGAAIET